MKTPTVAIDARLVGGTSTGDSTYWTGLLYGLSKLDPCAKILLLSNAKKPAGIPEINNCAWIGVPGRSRMWSYVKFPLEARRLGATAIHTQYSLSPLVGNCGFTTIHDVSFLLAPQWFKRRDRAILSRTIPKSIARAKRVFTVSNSSKREMGRFIPAARGKIVVTYDACPPWIKSVPQEEAKAVVAARFGIDRPFMLTVGTRWPRKNMELAVAAADRLPPAFPHSLVLTGKAGWGDQSIGTRGVAVGYVTNEELCSLYSAADLYLAPSLHEGFGVPLLEAFRCGCPVLCSSGGALPEVAADAADVEFSWTASAWATHIQELLSDSSKLELLRRKGHRRESEFSWVETAKLTLDAYFGDAA